MLVLTRANRFNDQFNGAIMVRPGNGFKEVGQASYEVDPANGGDFVKLAQALANRLPERVVHLWSETGSDLETRMQDGVFSLFHLTRALMDAKPKNPVRLLYVHPEGMVDGAACSGFMRGLILGNPKFI